MEQIRFEPGMMAEYRLDHHGKYYKKLPVDYRISGSTTPHCSQYEGLPGHLQIYRSKGWQISDNYDNKEIPKYTLFIVEQHNYKLHPSLPCGELRYLKCLITVPPEAKKDQFELGWMFNAIAQQVAPGIYPGVYQPPGGCYGTPALVQSTQTTAPTSDQGDQEIVLGWVRENWLQPLTEASYRSVIQARAKEQREAFMKKFGLEQKYIDKSDPLEARDSDNFPSKKKELLKRLRSTGTFIKP